MTSQWGFTFLTLYLFRLFAALPSKPLSTKLFSAGQGACFMGSWVRYLRYAPPKNFFIAAEEVQSSRIILPGALCIIFLKKCANSFIFPLYIK